MINGNVTEFVDNMYYGTEMYFLFQEKRYFIQGWVKGDCHSLVLDYDFDNEPAPEDYSFDGYIWEHHSKDSAECVQAFLDAPIWDGKTFYAVEQEMTWVD